MNVSLTPELETLVHEKVDSGLYTSASEVVREALRLLKERDLVQQQRLDDLRREIEIWLEQLRRGEVVSGEQVYAELQRLKASHSAKEAGDYWNGYIGVVASDGSLHARKAKQVVEQIIADKHA